MRHRERVLKTTNTGLYATLENWDEAATPTVDTTTVIRDTSIVSNEITEEMDDIVTSGFHTKSGNGAIINNPMTHVVTETWDYPFSYDILQSYEWRHGTPGDYHWHPVGTRWSGNQVCSALGADLAFLTAPVAPESDLLDLALTKAWSNVSLNEAQGMVMIAESHKTVLSLVSLTRRFIRIIKKVKSLDTKGLYGEFTPKELADRYMELRYAIRPLLYDINGTIKAMKYQAEKSPLRTTFRGYEHWSDEDSQESHRHNGSFFADGTRTQYILKRAKTSFDVRAGVLAELDTLSSLPVWGMTEPLEALWEIVPFSFIVDWFLNVGDTIAAFTPNFGLKALASWTVTTKIVERSSEITRSTADWPTTGFDVDKVNILNHVNSCAGGQVGEKIITKQRIPNPSRSLLPTISVNLNTLKLIDLLIIAKHVWSR